MSDRTRFVDTRHHEGPLCPACFRELPETPSEAVSRLLEYYARLDEQDQLAFVATLIGDVVTQRMVARLQPVSEPQGAA